jgi:hypothetical protein
MFSFTLGMAVAQSDHNSWTVLKKAIAIIQLAILDVAVVALCCW